MSDHRNFAGEPLEGVLQTRFGKPDGNCHTAALATILGVSLSRIPDVPASQDDFLVRLEEWLRFEYGLATLMVTGPTPSRVWSLGGVVHLASGSGPRDCRHTIVMCDRELVWDPHPAGGNLELYEIDTHWYFVPHRGVGVYFL